MGASANTMSLSWLPPEKPNGIILDYEIKYHEKVRANASHWSEGHSITIPLLSSWQQHEPYLSLSCTLTLSSHALASIQLPPLSADTARQSVLGRDGGRRICIEEKKGPGISAACLMCCTDRLNQSCQTLLGTGWSYMACFITVPAGPGRSNCPHDDCPA